jgi:hypothetical protein
MVVKSRCYNYWLGWLLTTVRSGGGVAFHGRLLIWTLDYGGGRPGVYVGCVEVTSLILYHPLVLSDGGVRVPQLGAERLDLSLCGW